MATLPEHERRQLLTPTERLTTDLAPNVLAMCKARGWPMDWARRGVYLHLEVSELIEAVRGKRGVGSVVCESADVLLALMSITENEGVPWFKVMEQAGRTCTAQMAVAESLAGQ